MFKVLIKFLIDPFNVFWLLLLIIVVVWYLKKDQLFKRLILSVVVWFIMISTPLIPNLVLNSLENRYEPVYVQGINDTEAEFHILVLGGGHGFDDRLPPNSLLSHNALGRLNEAIRLHRQLPNSKLILSGFSAISGRTTQAEMLKQTALLLGVEREVILLQEEPGNTYEEARVYSEKYDTGKYPVMLVTSASHMPRAVKVFKAFGIDPIPSPTNQRLKGSWKHEWIGLPAMANIENLKVGVYEYAGIFWHTLGNR